MMDSEIDKLALMDKARRLIGDITMNDLRDADEDKIIWLSHLRHSAGYLTDAITSFKKLHGIKE